MDYSNRKDAKNKSTVRFFVMQDGRVDGDVEVPTGALYFSIPVFGSTLSQKEGVVSVRQYGWHTGWRREESRIVGTFRAVPMDRARQRDGF